MENEILNEIKKLKMFQEERFDRIDAKLESLEVRIQNLEEKVEKLEVRIQNLEEKVEKLEVRIQNLEEKVEKLEVRIQNLEERVENIEEKVKNLEIKVKELDKELKKTKEEIINEYKIFVSTVDTTNKRYIKEIKDEVDKNTDDLNNHKERVKVGIKLLERTVV